MKRLRAFYTATVRLIVWCAVVIIAIPVTNAIWEAMKIRGGLGGGSYGLDTVTTALLTAVETALVMLAIAAIAHAILSIIAPRGDTAPRQTTPTILERQGRGTVDAATTVAHSRYATAHDVLMHGITGADEAETK